MFKHMNAASQQCQGMSGVERLSLRVSSMINHPLAQTQRWVVVHRLDTDGDAEWDEVMGLLLETPELNLTVHDDESVTVRWARSSEQARDDFSVEQYNEEVVDEAPPF